MDPRSGGSLGSERMKRALQKRTKGKSLSKTLQDENNVDARIESATGTVVVEMESDLEEKRLAQKRRKAFG